MSPKELITKIQQDRQAIASLWQGLTRDQMTHRPGPHPEWSVKDLIAHLSWWETNAMQRITILMTNHPAKLADVDALNARVFIENKDRSLESVLSEFESNLSRLEAQINTLSDDGLNDESRYPGGLPLKQYLIVNTYGHYVDHIDELRSYVESLD